MHCVHVHVLCAPTLGLRRLGRTKPHCGAPMRSVQGACKLKPPSSCCPSPTRSPLPTCVWRLVVLFILLIVFELRFLSPFFFLNLERVSYLYSIYFFIERCTFAVHILQQRVLDRWKTQPSWSMLKKITTSTGKVCARTYRLKCRVVFHRTTMIAFIGYLFTLVNVQHLSVDFFYFVPH